MPRRHLSAIVLVAVTAVAVLLLGGCNGSTSPSDETPRPSLANIWPHQDGTGWRYTITFEQYAALPVEATPPSLPSFEELHAALETGVPAEMLETDTGAYSLTFVGDTTTDSGVTAQNLVGVITPGSGKARRVETGHEQLRRALAGKSPGGKSLAGKSLADATDPAFLGTMAFAYEDSGYYGYGDLHREHSWIQLEGDLTEGSEFSMLLVPMLAEDIWLYGRIWSVRDRFISGRRWENVVECMYVVDLGTQSVMDDNGNLLGYSRGYWYGTVLYVPTVGPIACDERHVWGPSNSIMGPQPGGVNVYRIRR
jgi:hypothetical protein